VFGVVVGVLDDGENDDDGDDGNFDEIGRFGKVVAAGLVVLTVQTHEWYFFQK